VTRRHYEVVVLYTFGFLAPDSPEHYGPSDGTYLAPSAAVVLAMLSSDLSAW